MLYHVAASGHFGLTMQTSLYICLNWTNRRMNTMSSMLSHAFGEGSAWGESYKLFQRS